LAQLNTNNGYMYFKNQDQHLFGNGVNNLAYKSNNNMSSFSFYEKTNTRLGVVYGSLGTGGSKYFGLLDADGNWSYLTSNDSYTAFRINNENKMIIRNNGRVEIKGAADATSTTLTGLLDIGGSLRLDGDEIITNKDKVLRINYDNNGDVNFDKATLFVDASANGIGIGFSAPQTKLEVKGTVRATSTGGRGNRTEMGHNGSKGFINTVGAGNLFFQHDGKDQMSILDNGKVAIGSVNSNSNNYKLFVEKGILAEKVRVAVKNSGDWADYVFEENYDLNSLEEVETFVTENKHLPNVPSAEEVNKNGVDMAEMDATLLRQIEELWLHTIKLNERIQELEAGTKPTSN